MTDTMASFARARLDEEEADARAAMWDEQSGVWTARPPQASYERYIIADYLDDGVVVVTPENADPDGVAAHIARQDPARTLRRIARQRRAVEGHTECGSGGGYCDEGGHGWEGVPGGGCADLYDIVAVWDDHPDYRQAWTL
ncbi:DUF6221 family protein [Streptomyces sp. NBC_01217]|uniref:DUF6221 family protein n=1 Tax=Streptomyces sp. NBC_01217 TaxID=2903779 RepID=UPI002E1085FF|nr:DUF6221 family protein [Streptomyces sp. NBC_01217]